LLCPEEEDKTAALQKEMLNGMQEEMVRKMEDRMLAMLSGMTGQHYLLSKIVGLDT
jgi:hypothetical protein